MGRWGTGAQTTTGATSIKLSNLIKGKLLVKGSKRSGQLSWTSNGEPCGNIGIECSYFGKDDDCLRLYYTQTIEGVQTKYDYKIDLIERDSNLGKGKVLYMICSQSGNPCRILYMAYGSPVFKCRQAYKHRLYYPTQTASKNDRYNSCYWKLDRQITQAKKERFTEIYNGKITKRALRNQIRLWKQQRMDDLRFGYLAKALQKMGVSLD